MNDNRVVQGLWVGGRLSALERLCIRSFCAHGHEFHLYHYDELRNVPQVDGLRVISGEEILPRTAIFRYRKNNSLAGFGDRFRWELMRQKGGWHTDLDVVCMRPLDFAADVVMGYRFDGDINSALMKFPRGHFMAEALANSCANMNKFVPWDTPKRKLKKIKRLVFFRHDHKYMGWGEAGGPAGMTLVAKHFGLESSVLPERVLYSEERAIVLNFFNDSLHKARVLDMMLSGMYAIHVGNAWLAKAGIDKDGGFPEHSPFETLKRRYMENANGVR